MDNCQLNTSHIDSEVNRREAEFISVVKDKVNQIMGIDKIVTSRMGDDRISKEALKQWFIAKENLVTHIVKNARIVGYDSYPVDSYLRSIENALQSDVGIPLDSKSAWESGNPRRFLSMAKAINRMINYQDSRWGKKLNTFERAFLPIRMFAWRLDPIGHISKYVEDVTSVLENSRNSSAKYKDRYNDIMLAYRTNVFNAVESMTIIKSNSVIDGVKTTDLNGNEIIFLGSEERDNTVVHRVKYIDTNEVKLLGQNDISMKRVKEALVDKYTYELTNDLMHGQARYIIWKNEPTDEHKKEIQRILSDVSFKIENGDEKDSISGLPELHSMTISGGIKVNYVILKDSNNPKLGQPETYSAYIVNHKDGNQRVNYYEDRLTKSNREKFLDVTKIPQMKEGLYKSDNYKTYGKRIFINQTTGERFTTPEAGRLRGWDFSDLSGKSIKVDPYIASSRQDTGRNINTLYSTVSDLRSMYSDIGDEIKSAAESEFAKINEWLKPNGRAQQVLYPALKSKDAKEFLADIRNLFMVQNRIWVDKNGGIHTPNSHFMKMKENYSPVMFDDVTRDQMLDDFIELLSTEIQAGNRSEENMNMLDSFRLTKARIDNNTPLIDELENQLGITPDSDIRTILAQRNVYSKNRSEWTDLSLRRKDSLVHGEYVDNVFNNIHRNKLMVSMLEALEQFAKVGKNQFDLDAAKWVVNRAKIAYGDPMSWAGIGKIDFSYQRVADFLNKVPGLGRNWDAESSMKLINGTRGFFAATLLGSTGAMVNRTQIVNEAIKYGWNSVIKSAKILSGKDKDMSAEQALGIINYLGIDEVTNMLSDFMAHGGEVDMSDAGIISTPFGSMPTFALKDFAVTVINNRSGFIKNGLPDVDKVLGVMEYNRIKRYKDKIKAIDDVLAGKKSIKSLGYKVTMKSLKNEQNRLKSNLEKRKVEQLRAAFADLIMTDKNSSTASEIEARIKRLMGEVSENRLKRMVSWKLSWWFDGFAPELFTFTGSEQFMRRQSALIALFAAANMGQLGKFNSNIDLNERTRVSYLDKGRERIVYVPSIFLTEKAKQIARNAVNNSMFGMSSLHLGEAFNGFGSQLFMYKSYPLQQMIHDWKIVQGFVDSNENVKEVPIRLFKAMNQAYARYKKGIKYDEVLNSSDIDNEALMMLRFIGTRIGMTVFSVAAESISILRPFLRSPMYREVSTMLRGGENPLFGTMFRLAVNGLLWASMDEDDWFEGSMVEVGWDIARLFLPVFLTMPLYTFSETFFD